MRAIRAVSLVAALVAGGQAATGVYVVRPGDTLSAVAGRLHVPVGRLAAANRLANPNRIFVGQRLLIPGTAPAAPTAAHPTPAASGLPLFHVVQRGETLASIATAFHTTPQAIATANGIVDGRLLNGARLSIVAPGTPAPRRPNAAGTLGGAVHVVARGETLGALATRYRTTVKALASANGVRNPSLIRVGMRLTVPGSGWACPVAGHVTFVNDWGLPRERGTFHQGNDLMAPRGTPVVAPVSGTVRQIVGSVGGNQVWFEGDDGFRYINSHLDRFAATGHVAAGTVIGYVGDSGDAKGGPTHLHFEIHPGGGPAVNPYPTILAACGG